MCNSSSNTSNNSSMVECMLLYGMKGSLNGMQGPLYSHRKTTNTILTSTSSTNITTSSIWSTENKVRQPPLHQHLPQWLGGLGATQQ
jgi:hypothetical protein